MVATETESRNIRRQKADAAKLKPSGNPSDVGKPERGLSEEDRASERERRKKERRTPAH